MPTIPVHTAPAAPEQTIPNPLPQLLHTPSGLAILEIQGNINVPPPAPGETSTNVGRLHFPKYNKDNPEDDTSWQKLVHLYVGKHQRLTGEVKKLPKPLGVLRKRDATGTDAGDELEIMEIVYYKIIFSHRPEPVGDD